MYPHDPDKRLKLLGMALHGLGLAVTLVLAGLAYAFVAYPVWRDIGVDRQRAADLQQLLENAPQIRAQHAAMQKSLAEVQKEMERLQRRIPPEPAEAEFLSQLTSAAAGAGLVIRDFRPGVVRQAADHCRLEVQLACVGSYSALCTFLNRVTSLPRLARVNGLEVASTRLSGGYPITLSMTVFFQLDPKPKTADQATAKPESPPPSLRES